MFAPTAYLVNGSKRRELARGHGPLFGTEDPAMQLQTSVTGRRVATFAVVLSVVALAIIVVVYRGSIGRSVAGATDSAKVSRVSKPGALTEYVIPTANSRPSSIVSGPDGAMWFVERVGNKIGRLTVSGEFTEYSIPTARSFPSNITAGADGALWFAEPNVKKIGRLTTTGSFREFDVRHHPYAITSGPDGALWVADFGEIGRVSFSGAFTEFTLPSTVNNGPYDITTGPDRSLWFALSEQTTFTSTLTGARFTGSIARMTTSGVFRKYTIPTANIRTTGITNGPDGAIWFTESDQGDDDTRRGVRRMGGKVGRMTTSGTFTEFAIPTADSAPGSITAGPDGALWFTEGKGNKIGRVSTSGAFTEYALPSARSGPARITVGPDGALWFVEYRANKIGRITAR
jgi:streptogramin lyase